MVQLTGHTLACLLSKVLIHDSTLEWLSTVVFVFFFLAFAGYTIKAAREMNDVVFSSSCLQP